MSKQYIIGIDSGTSKVKAVLADLRGQELAIAAETTLVETPFDGWSEYDLQKDWQNVSRAVQKLLFQNRVNPEEIMGVGVTGKGWGCCYLDANNRPARKGILWNDARSGPYIRKWAKSGILSEAFNISGNYYYTGDCGPITRWLMDNEPQTVKQVASALFPTDWIAYKLTGKLRLVEGDASSLFDMYSRTYSDKLFDLLGISAMRSSFLTPASSTEVTGEVTTEAARATGLKAGTPVVLAEVDVSSCATGVGVIDPGDVCIILGTAHIVSIGIDEPIFAPEAGLMMTYVDGKYLKLVPPVIATPNVDWYLENFGHADQVEADQAGIDIFEHLEKKLVKIPAGADGVIYHPYMSPVGERCPFSKLTAKGNFFGLSLHHTRAHLLRAIYEGVAFSAYDCLLASNVELRDVMLSGGGAKSDVWAKIEADVFGRTVRIPSGEEFGAKGAIVTTMVALGLYPDHRTAISEIIKTERVFGPDNGTHAYYKKIFGLYRDIVQHLWGDWDRRAEILKKGVDTK
jgi:sugar (pentulose or hexulose) kinase